MENNTIAVASLKMLSPSRRVPSRRGAPTSLNRPITATGSVAEMSAPNRNAAPMLNTENTLNRPPMIPSDIRSPNIARRRIGTIFILRALRSIFMAAS
jgi:hypothetical protein